MVQWRAISFNIPTLDLDACRSMSGEIHHCWHMKSIIVGLLVTERGSILTQILRPSVWMVLQSMAFVFDEIGGTAVLLYSYIRNALITNSEFVRIGAHAIQSIGTSKLVDGSGPDHPQVALDVKVIQTPLCIFH